MRKRGKKKTGIRPQPDPQHLSVDMVLLVHEHLVAAFESDNDPISPPGVHDMGLLESAVHRQTTGFEEYLKYDTPCANAASLLYGICNNHCFLNGNKRTALVSALMHLDANGLVLEDVTRAELYELMLSVASHGFSKRPPGPNGEAQPDPDQEILEVTKWLDERSRRIKRGERSITYGELYRILGKFGYELGQKSSNRVEILKEKRTGILRKRKKVCVFRASCPGDARKVNLDELKKVRQALKLTEMDGVDSQSFYDTQSRIDAFITHHRGVLRQLART